MGVFKSINYQRLRNGRKDVATRARDAIITIIFQIQVLFLNISI